MNLKMLYLSMVLVTACSAQAQDRLYTISLVSIGVSHIFDATSTRGLRELNPALADSRQRFGARSAIVKTGIAGAGITPQLLLRRKMKNSHKRTLAIINFASAGLITAMAIHNARLH